MQGSLEVPVARSVVVATSLEILPRKRRALARHPHPPRPSLVRIVDPPRAPGAKPERPPPTISARGGGQFASRREKMSAVAGRRTIAAAPRTEPRVRAAAARARRRAAPRRTARASRSPPPPPPPIPPPCAALFRTMPQQLLSQKRKDSEAPCLSKVGSVGIPIEQFPEATGAAPRARRRRPHLRRLGRRLGGRRLLRRDGPRRDARGARRRRGGGGGGGGAGGEAPLKGAPTREQSSYFVASVAARGCDCACVT